MEYQESYHGNPIIITTQQESQGDWKAKAELVESGQRVTVEHAAMDDLYSSEEEARRAALTAAAGLIDRHRSSRGKP